MVSTYNFDDFFVHKTLDKIFGEPDTKTLRRLFKQLKRNARSVNTTLGGGQYGHLFMVIPNNEWNALPGAAPVQPPQDPGEFNLEGRVTVVEITNRQNAHDEAKKRYNKYQALQRILKNQLISAIEPPYLDPFRCDVTDMINESIPEIVDYLQSSYGKITVNQIEEAVAEIKNFTFDPTKSINILLNAVQEHVDLLKIAGRELQDGQIRDLAYYLIGKHQIFKEALTNWNKLPDPKTWSDMKIHMREEYQNLKDVNALSIKNSILNTTDIMQELKDQQEYLLHTAEKRFKNGLTEVMNLAIMDFEGKDKTNEENINNASEINTLKQEIQKLQYQLLNTSRNASFSTQSFNPRGNRFQNYRPRRNNNNNRFDRQFYCWTHGAGHSGWNCMNPADGH